MHAGLYAVIAITGCGFRHGAAGPADDGGGPGSDVGGQTTIDASADARIDARPADARPADARPDAAPPPLDCLDAYQHGVTTSGPLTIAPSGMSPFTVYCDMTTSGGGWTLVYVYTFADYANFGANSNAVTPRPTWPFSAGGSVPTSTTVPTDPTITGALDYSKWSALGSSFLVTSNVDNWYACTAGTASIVNGSQNGNIACTVANTITASCTTSTPNGINWYSTGPWLQGGAPVTYPIFIFYDGSTTAASWPTQDPCGMNGANQLGGVANPRGAIYLRRT